MRRRLKQRKLKHTVSKTEVINEGILKQRKLKRTMSKTEVINEGETKTEKVKTHGE